MSVDNSVLIEMLPGVIRSAWKDPASSSVDILTVDQDLLAEKANAHVVCHGNFTIAVIDYLGKIYIGEAKRNPRDTPNAKRGERLSLSRALKALVLDDGQ